MPTTNSREEAEAQSYTGEKSSEEVALLFRGGRRNFSRAIGSDGGGLRRGGGGGLGHGLLLGLGSSGGLPPRQDHICLRGGVELCTRYEVATAAGAGRMVLTQAPAGAGWLHTVAVRRKDATELYGAN